MRSGKEDKSEVPADNGQGIWAGSTPENLRREAAGIKSSGTRKEKYPKTLQVWSKWEGPYVVRETHDSGYYYLAKVDGTSQTNPINGKWLKQYYA